MDELVGDLMTRSVAVIRRDHDLHELERLLLRHGVHGVPVVDESHRIVGVVSQTDLLAWHFETGIDGAPFYDRPDDRHLEAVSGRRLRLSDSRTALVADVMSPLVHCIGPDKTLAEAATRMIRERIHRLVVVDTDYAVVGILSATDLLRSIPGVATALAASA